MINLTFSSTDIEALHYKRFHHPHPRVQRKMEALYLRVKDYRMDKSLNYCALANRR